MLRAIGIAKRAVGRVHPNPLVGALVVREGAVVAEGWHAEFGGVHAERMALDAAGAAAQGATLYCSLEPCTHQGKQPPCVDAIIAAGIARVVVAARDPNPVAAGGIERLRAAGITVDESDPDIAMRARIDNGRFAHQFRGLERPWIALKLAVTMDGYLADREGRSRWLSGPDAREWVHGERASVAAIAVGAETAVRDDVRLIVRGDRQPAVPPTRVIFDRRGIVPVDHGIFRDAADVPVMLVRAPGSTAPVPDRPGVSVLEAGDLGSAMRGLWQRGLDSVLVEGGGRLAGALLEAELVDRIYQVQVPAWLGAGRPAWAGLAPRTMATITRWHTRSVVPIGDDTVLVLER